MKVHALFVTIPLSKKDIFREGLMVE